VISKYSKQFPGLPSRIDDINLTIRNYISALNRSIAKINAVEETIDARCIKEQLKKEMGIDPIRKKRVTLNEFITTYINDIEKNKRLTPRGTPFAKGTLKNYKNFKVVFDAYQKKYHRNIDFADVTLELREKLVVYCNSLDYSQNTIQRHVKQLKAIMNVAREERLHDSTDFQLKKFTVPQIETKDIYLSESELDAIYNLNLSDKPNWDLARDVFLIGCYTAQRFSDYSRITKEDIEFKPDGKFTISLIQKKTGVPVTIPSQPRLKKLLEKYDYTLPKTYEQKVNEYIKKVVEKAKITDMEVIESLKGGKKITSSKQRNKLVKTHTARRTGATNMFLAGIPPISIMRITGHRTEREFLKYIKITNQQNASNLADHPYFN
jgi:integrase